MKKKTRLAAALMAAMMTVTMTAAIQTQPAQAASKKPAYVMTKVTVKDYTDDTISSLKCSYKKDGMLKSMKVNFDSIMTVKSKFKYGKKSLITQSSITTSDTTGAASKETARFTYTKKGFLKKATLHNKKGKKTYTTKLKHNGKGYITSVKEYDNKGRLVSSTKKTVDKKGRPVTVTEYDAATRAKTVARYTYTGNTGTSQTRDAAGNLIASSVVRYQNGNLVSETICDETSGHKTRQTTVYTYKKVKTTKASKVKQQQRDIEELFQ